MRCSSRDRHRRRRCSSRYVAPVTEETAQGRVHRAAALAHAASASSSTRRCRASPSAPASRWSRTSTTCGISATRRLALWLVRGLGTAMLHGATTAVFAMVSKTLVDRAPRPRAAGARCPAWPGRGRHPLGVQPCAAAAAGDDRAAAAGAAARGRRRVPAQRAATREWVGAGLDLDVELLELVALGALRVHPVRPVSAGAARRASAGRSSPTCSACCGWNSSCRCRRRRC